MSIGIGVTAGVAFELGLLTNMLRHTSGYFETIKVLLCEIARENAGSATLIMSTIGCFRLGTTWTDGAQRFRPTSAKKHAPSAGSTLQGGFDPAQLLAFVRTSEAASASATAPRPLSCLLGMADFHRNEQLLSSRFCLFLQVRRPLRFAQNVRSQRPLCVASS